MRPIRFNRLAGTTALSTVLLTAGAMAQDAGTSSSDIALEEIVVTARMRAESLQDVPLSETAFSAQQIKDARVDQVSNFINLTPNVVLSEAQSAGTSFMTIRGVSQVRNGESPVATVVDGVLQINSRQFTQELFDIEQIEVLRGPQGALYGRNAIGGAILISTRKPTNEFEGYARAGIGKGGEYVVESSFSGPIVEDKVLFRLSGRYRDREGYLDNPYLGVKADPYEDLSLRGMVQLFLSERLTADVRASISRTDGGALNYQYQSATFQGDTCFIDNPFGDFGAVSADNVSRRICSTNLGEAERNIDELSVKLDYEADAFTLTNIFSWNRVEEYSAGDQFPYTASIDVLGSIDGTQTQYADVEAWSNELRIASSTDSRLQWMAGVYYLETDRFLSSTVGDDNGQGITHVEREPFYNDAANPTVSFLADDNNNTAWALFGNVAYDVTDAFELSFAARYDEDHRKQYVLPISNGALPAGCSVATPENCNKEETFSKFQPKVTARYDLSEDASLYGSWGIGFRSGQFNQSGTAEAALAGGVAGVKDVVDQEEVETWELGFKSELFDKRLRFNTSAFYTTDKNPFYFVFIGEVGAQVLVNIDEVELYGIEVEATANLFEGFDAYTGFGYTKSEIKDYATNPGAVGNWAPYVPRTTFNLGAQYRTSITENLGVFARVD
ncbi:TonB-dependent receptor, partial [Kordiimonas sp.]|uniref:TonB-dependent receptor n=1 Tax=Kordiimonas sp. TaxID=1970157 RepID=UPI003A93A3D4